MIIYGGYVIQFVILVLIFFIYERKIKKLKKELNKKIVVGESIKNCSLPIREFVFEKDFRGYLNSSIEERIKEFTDGATEDVWHCYKNYLEESIFSAVWDKLVTDDRTVEDNSVYFDIRLRIPYILPDRHNIEVKICKSTIRR